MFFEPYNPIFLNIIKRAKFEAKFKLKSDIIEPEHILLAFLKSHKYSTYKILHDYNLFYKSILKIFKYNYQNIKKLNKRTKNYSFSPLNIEIFQNAEKIKKIFKHNLLSPEILLYSLLNFSQSARLIAILKKNKINTIELRCKLLNRLTESLNFFLIPSILKNLDKGYKKRFFNFYGFIRYKNDYLVNLYYNKVYVTSLTNKQNDIYAVGHEKIVQKTINLLSLKSENHIIIHGKPGVGKTTFMYNLIRYIEENETPLNLIIKEFISINLIELLHNVSEEENFTSLLKDVFKLTAILRNKVIILDNLHLIFNPKAINATQTKSINALRPFFTKKNLFNFIGLLDSFNYNEFVKSDSIFSKYAKILELPALNFNETLMIVNNLKRFYEIYYGITITDNAILAILDNANQLISTYEMPKKALIFLDEACSYLKYVTFSENTDFKHLIFALTLAQSKYLYTNSLTKKKYKLASLFYKYEECLYLFLEIFIKLLHSIFSSNIYFLRNNIILSSFITQIISAKVLNLTSEETSKALSYYINAKGPTLLNNEELVSLELDIQKQIVGQSNAIKHLVDAVRRDALKLRDRNRPIGTFLFIGPTGVGKTEMAKVLAKIVYKDDIALLRFDMSEYSEEHSISKLIGATAGYVGFEEGGHLTNLVKKHPFSIILFDEIEKSHSSIYNLLLQVLDEGRLTTGQGETVSFTNTLIILTSNIAGTELLKRQLKLNNYIKNCQKLKRDLKLVENEKYITTINKKKETQNNIISNNTNNLKNKEMTIKTGNDNPVIDAEIINKEKSISNSEKINTNERSINTDLESEILLNRKKASLIKKYNLDKEETTNDENSLISKDIKSIINIFFEKREKNIPILNSKLKLADKIKTDWSLSKPIDEFLNEILKKTAFGLTPIQNKEKEEKLENNFRGINPLKATATNKLYFENEINSNLDDKFIDDFLKNIETTIQDKNSEHDIFASMKNELEFKEQILQIQKQRSENELEEDIKIEKQILDEKLVEAKLSEKLPPEFINRLDAIIIFDPFTESEAYEISRLLIENFCKRMYELKKYKITYNIKVLQKIVKKGYDIELGARPLKRALNEIIEVPFADFLMITELPEYSYIHINFDENNEISFLTS